MNTEAPFQLPPLPPPPMAGMMRWHFATVAVGGFILAILVGLDSPNEWVMILTLGIVVGMAGATAYMLNTSVAMYDCLKKIDAMVRDIADAALKDKGRGR